jgi:hypothetical protein
MTLFNAVNTPPGIITPTQFGVGNQKVREAELMVATGFKGVGKTHETIRMLMENYTKGNPFHGTKPRRVLILDVNDEYGEYGIKSIPLEWVPTWMKHPTIDIRRIRPFKVVNGVGTKMNIDEILATLETILGFYAGGCLLIEDLNKIVGDHMKLDLTGTICTSRHINCDIIMHYQSVGRPLPKIWQNTDMVRFHWQSDDVMASKGKLMENTTPLKICQMLVQEQRDAGNERFFVYYNRNKNKIIGNFTKEKFLFTLEEYISENNAVLRPLLQKTNREGKKLYNHATALDIYQAKLYKDYWGNAA